MEWVRVVVCNYVSSYAGFLYFGSVFGSGVSVVFRNKNVRVGEVYNVTLIRNDAPAEAKAKHDVVEYERVPTHEFTNIRVTDDNQVLVTCLADFVSYDHRTKSVKIFRNEIFGTIVDLNDVVPRGMMNAEVEFRFTSSPRDKFTTICVVTKFIRGNRAELREAPNSCSANREPPTETGENVEGENTRREANGQKPTGSTTKDKSDPQYANRELRVRDFRSMNGREAYLLDSDDEESGSGTVIEKTPTPYRDHVAEELTCEVNSSVSSDDWDSYETAIDDSRDEDVPVSSINFVRQHKGFLNFIHRTGEAVIWCLDLYRDLIVESSDSETLLLGKWYEFNITEGANPAIIMDSIRRIKNFVTTSFVSGRPELKCYMVYDENLSKTYRECILFSDLVGKVVCDIPSLCEQLGPGCSLTASIVRFNCRGGRVCWVVSCLSAASIEKRQLNICDDSSYERNDTWDYVDNEVTKLPSKFKRRCNGFVNHFYQSGEAVVWCMELGRDIILDLPYSKSVKLGEWIEFDIIDSDNSSIVPDTILVTKDQVLTRIVNGHPELKCSLVFDEKSSITRNECILYSDQVGLVLCDIPLLCNSLGPGWAIKTWIVRFKCRDRVRWVISSKTDLASCDIQKVDICDDNSFIQNTPSDSGTDYESQPDSHGSPHIEEHFYEEMSPSDTLDFVFNKHPSLLDLLANVDDEALQRIQQIP